MSKAKRQDEIDIMEQLEESMAPGLRAPVSFKERSAYIFLNKNFVYNADFYCPFTKADGSIDTDQEIFEFSIDKKHWAFGVEQTFLMRDGSNLKELKYLVLAETPCRKYANAVRIRALYKGEFI